MNKGEKLTDKQLADLERAVLAEYKEALAGILAEIQEIYLRYGDGVTLTEMNKFNRLLILQKKIREILKKKFGIVESRIFLNTKKISEIGFFNVLFAGEQVIRKSINLGNLNIDDFIAAQLNKYDLIKWRASTKQARDKLNAIIKNEITQALLQGYGYKKTGVNIRRRMEKNAYEVIRIARTEGQRARNVGKLAGYEKLAKTAEGAGVEIRKIWIATLDDRTRPTHRRLDGQRADDEGYFSIDGLKAPAPSLFGVAEEDINCRCTVGIDLIEPEQLERRSAEGIIENISFEDFAARYGYAF
jgi:hypothetical protein